MKYTDQGENSPSTQQQSLGDVQVQGDDNIFNAIQATVVTLTQNKIIQISIDEIKTRPFVIASPYKGLRSFEPEDKDQFFGRDQLIAGLINELEQTNLILLLGASGSGKSSVVRAGLVPWLCQQWGTRLVNLTLRPDLDPFESLYGSLLGRFKQSDARLARGGQVDTLTQIVKRLKQPESFGFIFIDQFEELFTISDQDKRDRFITSLAKLCQEQAADRTLKIVATMRADFLDRLDAEPVNRLARLTDKHRPLMTQMYPDELRLAIEQPAAHHGVVFEQGLVETIIKDVQGQAGYLPLLQYTLNQLWESEVRDGGIHDRTLNIHSYRLIGGVRGALQKRVSQIYAALSEPEKLAAQRIFLKLVGIGGNSTTDTDWKPVRKREMRSRFSFSLEQKVLTQLINASLLVSDAPAADSKATVEIAHEILLSSWDELRGWIEQNREAIALRNRINEDASRWKIEKLDDELWSGTKLAQAIDLKNDSTFNQVLGGFGSDILQFIEASQEVRDRQQREKEVRRRRTMFGLASFSAVTLVLAGTALYYLQQAQRQRVKQLAATAEALLATQPVEATIHAIAAYGLSQSPLVQFPDRPRFDSAEDSLFNAQRANAEQQRFLHNTEVYAVAISPDGQTIASGGGDNVVQLLDTKTGKLKGQPFVGHIAEVYAVAFSPDGQTIASGGGDKTVRLWDAQTGELKHTLTGYNGIVTSISFSSDGKTIASGSLDKTVQLWDFRTGEPIRNTLIKHKSAVYTVAFSPDGKTIASGGRDKTVQLWNTKTGESKGEPWIGHESEIHSVEFSPDGTIIASSSSDQTIRLWDSNTGELRNKLTGHDDPVYTVAFSPDGKTIASSGEGRNIKLWDSNTGEIKNILTGHGAAVYKVAFGPDGESIISGSGDRSVRLWNIQTGVLFIGHKDKIVSVNFSPDGKVIASGSWDKTVRLWDQQTGVLKHTLSGHNGQVNSVSYSPNGKVIASGSSDQTVRLWDAHSGRLKHTLTGHEDMIMSVAFSPDGDIVASGGRDQTVRLWDAHSGRLKHTLTGHEDMIMSVAFSPDGDIVASGGRDQTVRLWDAHSGRLKHTLTGHEDEIRSIAFSPDGKIIASGSMDNTIRFWKSQDGSPFGEPLAGSMDQIRSIAFSPDGKMVVMHSNDLNS